MKTTNDILGRIAALANNGNRRTSEQISNARERTESDNRKRDAIGAITALLATVAAITTPVRETVYSQAKEAKRQKRQKQRRSRQHRLSGLPLQNRRKPAKLLAFGQHPDNSANVKWSDGSTVYSFPSETRWNDTTTTPVSLVTPDLWERVATTDNVYGYDENDDSVLLICVVKPDTDTLYGHCGNVKPQQSRSIRKASELNTFDRISFLTNALRQLRDSTNNGREEFEKVISELSDADFLQSLRGYRKPLGYKKFRVVKSRAKVWTWQPSRRTKYLEKIENCRNGIIKLRDGTVKAYKPLKIVTRPDGAPIVWRSIGWAKLELHKNPGQRDNARKGRAYRQLDSQIWAQWKRLEKCGVSASQRDDFWAESEQQAAMTELQNRSGFDGNGKPFPPVINTFKVAVQSVYFATMRRLRLKEISAETDYSESGKRNLVQTPADAVREKLSGEEKAVCYLMSQGITLIELANEKTISRRDVQTYAKRFRELGILR